MLAITRTIGGELALLRDETVIPACSPQMRDEYRFQEAADIRKAPLLHLTTRPDAWERWMELNGVPSDAVHGMLFDQFATAAQAAMVGLGVALLPEFLIEEELAAGRLVAAIDLPMKSSESYYLAWPKDRETHPPLAAFRRWLLEECRR